MFSGWVVLSQCDRRVFESLTPMAIFFVQQFIDRIHFLSRLLDRKEAGEDVNNLVREEVVRNLTAPTAGGQPGNLDSKNPRMQRRRSTVTVRTWVPFLSS